MYLLKLALRPWRLAPWSQIFSTLAVGILLLLGGFIVWLDQGMKPLIARMQKEQIITAYLSPGLKNKQGTDIPEVVDTIRTTLGSAEMHWVGSDEFVKHIKENYPDLGAELDGLGPEADTIIPRYVSISGVFDDSAMERLRSIRGVEATETSKDRHRQSIGAFRALRWVGRLLIAGLGIALVTGLIHLSRLNASLYRDAISVMKLWGASLFTLHVPGMISGLSVGVTGGVIAFSSWIFFATKLSSQLNTLSPILKKVPQVSPEFGLLLLAAGALFGLLSGWMGGFSNE